MYAYVYNVYPAVVHWVAVVQSCVFNLNLDLEIDYLNSDFGLGSWLLMQQIWLFNLVLLPRNLTANRNHASTAAMQLYHATSADTMCTFTYTFCSLLSLLPIYLIKLHLLLHPKLVSYSIFTRCPHRLSSERFIDAKLVMKTRCTTF